MVSTMLRAVVARGNSYAQCIVRSTQSLDSNVLQSYIRLAVLFATDNAAVTSSVMTCVRTSNPERWIGNDVF
jgi:hypothetical protein